MQLWLALLLIGGLGAVGIGCGSDDDEELSIAVDCDSDTATYDDVSAFDQCVKCHSSDLTGTKRMLAPPDINFDTFEGATAKKALKAPDQIEAGAMPPKSSGITITTAQARQLVAWYECGTKK